MINKLKPLLIKGLKNPSKIKPYLINSIGKKRSKLFLNNPKTIYLTVNNNCNLKCVMCDIGQGNRKTQLFKNLIKEDMLSLLEWKKFLDEVKGFSPRIFIVGTEPLLYRDLLPLIEYIKKIGLYVSIGTNGFLLERYAEEFVNLGVDELSVSIDGVSAIHDEIRGVKGVYEKCILGIQKIQKYELETSAKLMKVKINYCVSNYNYHNLYDFIDGLVKEISVSELTFSHLNFVDEDMEIKHNKRFSNTYPVTSSCIDAVDPKLVNCKVLWENICKIKNRDFGVNVGFIPQLYSADEVYIYYNEPNQIVSSNNCYVPWVSTSIQANGDVIILARCCIKLNIGNIKEKDFASLWQGKELENFRKALRNEKIFTACTRCCGVLS